MTVLATDPQMDHLLGLGDDALILGQRLSEWCGHAPTIEVDLSLANLGLDLIGQATLLLDYAGQIEGQGRDGDKLAFHRDGLDFRNCLLVEQPNGDFARTMARQFFYSTFQLLHYEALCHSADSEIAAIAAKAVKECDYHAGIAREWVERLGDGTDESHRRIVDGIAWTWRFVDELFEMTQTDTVMLARGVGADRAALRPQFDAVVHATLRSATVPQPAPHRPVTGGRRGRHGEHLGHLLATMQHLPRSHPDAHW